MVSSIEDTEQECRLKINNLIRRDCEFGGREGVP